MSHKKIKRGIPNFNFGRDNHLSLPRDGGWLGNGQIGRQHAININPNSGSTQFGTTSNVLGLQNSGDVWTVDPAGLQFGRQQQDCIGGVCLNRNIGFSG